MSFLTPPPSDDEPSRDGETTSRWNTPPASDPAPSFTASWPVAGAESESFSHNGLASVDPWSTRQPWHHAIWPWGLGGVVETLDVLVLALMMFLCVRFVAHNYIVEGASMVPTFEDSDFLIVNRLAYRSFDFSWIPGVDEDEWRPFGSPEPGDVIVFIYQEQPRERDFIKRVIALPGQTVEVIGGVVHVDGVPLDESYIAQPPAYEMGPTVVEPGTLFVLGDNRNNSFDSHSFGAIPEESVVGRADLRYWPISRWGLIEHVLGDGSGTGVARQLGRAGEGLAAAWW